MRSLIHGTGSASFLFWLVVLGGFMYLFLPDGEFGMIGILTGIFAGIRLENNGLKEKIQVLEAKVG